MAPAVFKADERTIQHAKLPAALVAHLRGAFDADERRGVTQPAQLTGDLVGDQLSVRENLEITIRVLAENL